MNQKALVSVLLPVYNANIEHLRISIFSVLRQTYKNFELLVLYEGEESEDCCCMIKDIVDSRIRIIIIPSKTGLPRSLNIGIKNANGKYIARMDSDDFALPNRIERQVNYLENHPDISVVGGVCRYMNSRELAFSTMIPSKVRVARMLFGNAGVAHPTAIIRNSFLTEKGILYNETIKGSEDYHLWTDIVLAGGEIESISKIVLLYRISDNQASKVLKSKMVDWDNMARERLLDSIGFFSQEEKHIFYRFCDVNNYRVDVVRTIEVLSKIRIQARTASHLPSDVIAKEVFYEWINKAIKCIKNGNGKQMLKITVLKKLWTKGEAGYLISEYYRKIKGKVVTNLLFQRRKYKC